MKENQNKDLLSGSWNSENTININIRNLSNFKELLEDVEKKEKELQIAVQKLRNFDLEVNFDVID